MSFFRLYLTGVFAFLAALPVTQSAAAADAVTLKGEMTQGALIRGKAPAGSRIRLNNKPVPINRSGHFVFGFTYNYASTAELKVILPDKSVDQRTLKIKARTYPKQHIKGLPKKYVSPPATLLKRIKRENATFPKARAKTVNQPWNAGDWQWPVIGPITGVYGSQRILNGKPKRPHFAVDVAAPTGTPIQSPIDGRIVLAAPSYFYTGGTVMIDHGQGVTSIMAHMHSVDVKVGDFVEKGQAVGTVGSTGRATGPHLHWSVNWYGVRVDPQLVVGPMPRSAPKPAKQ